METDKKTQSNVVRSYQRYLKLQRGFSPHTVEAYQRDLEKLLNYLKQEGHRSEFAVPDTERCAQFLPIPGTGRVARGRPLGTAGESGTG